MWRRLIWYLASIMGLTLIGVLLFVAFYDFDEAIEAQKEAYLPQLTALLGREVTAGPVEAAFWPHLGGTLRDVRVAGPTPDAAPLVKIERVFLAVDSEDALYSWGADVRVVALVLTGVELNLTRNPDGTYAHEEVFARVRARQAANDDATLDPKGERFIRGLRLDALEIDGGRVVVHGAQGPPGANRPLDAVRLAFTDVARGEPYGVELEAAVGGDRQNLSLRARLGPTVSTKRGPFTPIQHLSIHIDRLHMGTVAPYLKSGHWDWAQATIDGRWDMEDPYGLTPHTSVQGTLTMSGLHLIDQDQDSPFELSTRMQLVMDRTEGRLTVKDSALSLGGITLVVGGDVSQMYSRAPRLEGVLVETRALDLARLLAYLPGLADQLPSGASLAGPAALSLRGKTAADGPIVELSLHLDAARLDIPGILGKAPGDPLRVHALVNLREEDVRVQLAPLVWGPMTLNLDGQVGHDGKLALDGELVTNAPEQQSPEPGRRRAQTDPLSLRLGGHLRAPRLTGPGAQVIPRLVDPDGTKPRLRTALERISPRPSPETAPARRPADDAPRSPP